MLDWGTICSQSPSSAHPGRWWPVDTDVLLAVLFTQYFFIDVSFPGLFTHMSTLMSSAHPGRWWPVYTSSRDPPLAYGDSTSKRAAINLGCFLSPLRRKVRAQVPVRWLCSFAQLVTIILVMAAMHVARPGNAQSWTQVGCAVTGIQLPPTTLKQLQ